MTESSTQASLESLEREVVHALETGDESALRVLGYGEITTVFRMDTAAASFACKRFPAFQSREMASEHARVIDCYIEALAERGVRTLGTEAKTLQQDDGRAILYLVQPMIAPERLGHNYLRSVSQPEALAAFGKVLDLLRASVSSTLAPDGQLSNWAFMQDGEIVQIDVSTPFMRDEAGQSLLNWEPLLVGAPAPLRPFYRKKIPEVISPYFTLRGQLLDLLANLRKEKLDHLLPAFIPFANDRLGLEEVVTFEEVRNYYNEDADFYALIMRIKRLDRWVQRHLLRRTYPNFIPPPIERNKF